MKACAKCSRAQKVSALVVKPERIIHAMIDAKCEIYLSQKVANHTFQPVARYKLQKRLPESVYEPRCLLRPVLGVVYSNLSGNVRVPHARFAIEYFKYTS